MATRTSSAAHIPFRALNIAGGSAPLPTASATSFPHAIKPPPSTNLWRVQAPPHTAEPPTNFANAPIIYKSVSVRSFQSVRATIECDFRAGGESATTSAAADDDDVVGEEYMQGGLVFILPNRERAAADDDDDDSPEHIRHGTWIKLGLEVFRSRVWVGIVTARPWADWSLVPHREPVSGGAQRDAALSSSSSSSPSRSTKSVSLLIEREPEKGRIMIYLVEKPERDGSSSDGSGDSPIAEKGATHEEIRTPLREVTWALHEGRDALDARATDATTTKAAPHGDDDADGDGDRELWIGAWAAQPGTGERRTGAETGGETAGETARRMEMRVREWELVLRE